MYQIILYTNKMSYDWQIVEWYKTAERFLLNFFQGYAKMYLKINYIGFDTNGRYENYGKQN